MKVKVGMTAFWGSHIDEIGRVSAIRRNGFYVRYRSAYPTVPGGNKFPYRSKFFLFSAIGASGYDGEGISVRGLK